MVVVLLVVVMLVIGVSGIKSHPSLPVEGSSINPWMAPGLISGMFSVIQQFSGATVIRGYVVKMFGSIFHSSALSGAGGNLTALCECQCATGRV